LLRLGTVSLIGVFSVAKPAATAYRGALSRLNYSAGIITRFLSILTGLHDTALAELRHIVRKSSFCIDPASILCYTMNAE
jgi:hypothetical protein